MVFTNFPHSIKVLHTIMDHGEQLLFKSKQIQSIVDGFGTLDE